MAVKPRTGAVAAYVGLSRGREANTVYIVTIDWCGGGAALVTGSAGRTGTYRQLPLGFCPVPDHPDTFRQTRVLEVVGAFFAPGAGFLIFF